MENQKELKEEFTDEVPDEEEKSEEKSQSASSGELRTDSEDDEDAYLADDDGSEYKLDIVSPDSIKKTSHNKEMLLVCRRVRNNIFDTLFSFISYMESILCDSNALLFSCSYYISCLP